MGRLQGKIAIVTGAAHGDRAALGAVFAVALAKEGAKVVVADRRDCASVAKEVEAAGSEALALSLDGLATEAAGHPGARSRFRPGRARARFRAACDARSPLRRGRRDGRGVPRVAGERQDDGPAHGGGSGVGA